MSENREEILANFQSITAIDDVSEAIFHLEECNWDLLVAIQRVMSHDNPTLPPSSNQDIIYDISDDINSVADNISNPVKVTEPYSDDVIMRAPSSPDKNWKNLNNENTKPGPSNVTSHNNFDLIELLDKKNNKRNNNIQIIIHYKANMYKIVLSENQTIGDLKEKINKLTLIRNCRQSLTGWQTQTIQKEAQNDSAILKNLVLSKETDLFLTNLTEENSMDDEGNSSDKSTEYVLHIYLQREKNTITLTFRGEQTLLDVKNGVYNVTDIAVRHQNWSGWPYNFTNNMTLAQSGIASEHNLILKSNESSENSKQNRSNKSNIIEIDSDSSVEEFEDASDFNADDDIIFTEAPRQNRSQLIADQVESETIGCLQFSENYIQRYGSPHPDFFLGNLEDAFKDACQKPAKDRKLLAIYLHHDGSVLTNVFCSQLLSCESILQTLSHNFVFYGWDMTHESNKNLLLSSISACIESSVAMRVRTIPVYKLPAIIIIAKFRSACELLAAINGDVSVDDLLSQLMEQVVLFSERQKTEIKDESERAAREQVKMEQDVAYRESLEIDRAKEEAKKQKELMLANERKRVESEKAEFDAKREAVRSAAEVTLPIEPSADSTEDISKIKITKPEGGQLERRFLADTKLKILLNFIVSSGFPMDEYRVIASFPRRDLTTLNPDDDLRTLKLYPQETLRLEQR